VARARAYVLQETREALDVGLLAREDLLHESPRDRVAATEVAQHLTLGMTALSEAARIEVGLAVQLHDACSDPVGMGELLLCTLEKFLAHRFRNPAERHEVVLAAAQSAHELRRKCLVQQPQHRMAVCAARARQRAVLDLLPRNLRERGDITQLRCGSLCL